MDIRRSSSTHLPSRPVVLPRIRPDSIPQEPVQRQSALAAFSDDLREEIDRSFVDDDELDAFLQSLETKQVSPANSAVVAVLLGEHLRREGALQNLQRKILARPDFLGAYNASGLTR
jgi:hypothetical protein